MGNMGMNPLERCYLDKPNNSSILNKTIEECCKAQDNKELIGVLIPIISIGISISLAFNIAVLLYTWYLAWWTDKHISDLHPDEIIVDENSDEEDEEYDNGVDNGFPKIRSRQSFADMYEVVPDEIMIKNTRNERRASLFPTETMEGIDEEESSMDEQDTTEEEHSDKEGEYGYSIRSSLSETSVIENDERGDSVEIAIPEDFCHPKEDTDLEDCESRRDSGDTTDGQSIVNSDVEKDEKKINEKDGNQDRPVHEPRRRKYRPRYPSNESKKFVGQYTLPVRDGKLQRTHSQHAAHQILQLMVNPEEYNNEKEEEPPEKVKTPSPRKFSMDVFASGKMFNGKFSPRASLSSNLSSTTSEKFERSQSENGASEQNIESSPTAQNLSDDKLDKKFNTLKSLPRHMKPSIQFFTFNSLPRNKKMSVSSPNTSSDRARKASTESQRNLTQEDVSTGGRGVPRGQGDRSGSIGYNPQRRTAITFDRVVDVAEV